MEDDFFQHLDTHIIKGICQRLIDENDLHTLNYLIQSNKNFKLHCQPLLEPFKNKLFRNKQILLKLVDYLEQLTKSDETDFIIVVWDNKKFKSIINHDLSVTNLDEFETDVGPIDYYESVDELSDHSLHLTNVYLIIDNELQIHINFTQLDYQLSNTSDSDLSKICKFLKHYKFKEII